MNGPRGPGTAPAFNALAHGAFGSGAGVIVITPTISTATRAALGDALGADEDGGTCGSRGVSPLGAA